MQRLHLAIIGLALASLSGCTLLFGGYGAIGAYQDDVNRRINDKAHPADPPSQRLPTNYQDQGHELDAPEIRDEWRAFLSLFRPRYKKLPFRDEPSRCLPDEVVSCSVSTGCDCKPRPPSKDDAIAIDP